MNGDDKPISSLMARKPGVVELKTYLDENETRLEVYINGRLRAHRRLWRGLDPSVNEVRDIIDQLVAVAFTNPNAKDVAP